MADIRAGDEISENWWPPAVMDDDATNIDNITNTTFQAGSPVVSVTFTAPSTGRVAICVQAGLEQDSATDRVALSYEVYLGTSSAGTLVRGGRTPFGVSSPGGNASDELVQGNMTMLDGLTAGSTYYAQTVHLTEGGAVNDINHRRIIVFPLP